MTRRLPGQVSLRTERMRLRSLVAQDEALFCSLYCDRDTMRFVGPPLSPQAATRWFRDLLAPGGGRQPLLLAMEERTGGRLGLCGVTCWVPDARHLEVGILLLAEARARGFAREGMTALLRWLFETTAVDEIRVEFSAECAAVRRLNERIGFAPCAIGGGRAGSGRLTWSVGRASWGRVEKGDGNDGRNRSAGSSG